MVSPSGYPPDVPIRSAQADVQPTSAAHHLPAQPVLTGQGHHRNPQQDPQADEHRHRATAPTAAARHAAADAGASAAVDALAADRAGCGAAGGVWLVLQLFASVLAPFVAAAVIAYALDPPTTLSDPRSACRAASRRW